MQKSGLRTFISRYRVLAGIIISLLISVLAAFPRIVRLEDAGQILSNVTYAFLLAGIYWLIHHYFVLSRLWQTPRHRWKLVVVSITASIVVSLLFHVLIGPALKPNILLATSNVQQRVILLSFRALIVSGLLFFIIYWMELLTETQRSRTEIERLKKETLQSKLATLKQQISPHFLFNTMNTLSSLTREPKVKDYIEKFSNVYRYLLSHKDYDLVKLRDEMQFVNSYLYILRERFEDAIQVQVLVDNNVVNKSIPPLAVQTLIENAIKHNVVAAAKPLHIEIFDQDDKLVVRNNLQHRQSTDQSFGQGLSNLEERYQLLANLSVEVERTDRHFIVKLPLI